MLLAIALLTVTAIVGSTLGEVATPPPGATLENPDKRSLTQAQFGIDAKGDRIVAMLAGLPESSVSLIDLDARRITNYRISIPRVRIARVALSGDGETIYVGGSILALIVDLWKLEAGRAYS